MHVFRATNRSFALTNRQLSPEKLSSREELRLALPPRTREYESELAPLLNTMPLVAIRAGTENSVNRGTKAFLITAKGFEIAIFFSKLYATALKAMELGLDHTEADPQSKCLTISFFTDLLDIRLGQQMDGYSVFNNRSNYLNSGEKETTFPISYTLPYLSAQLHYSARKLSEAIRQTAKKESHSLDMRQEVKISSIIYRDIIEVLISLSNRPPTP